MHEGVMRDRLIELIGEYHAHPERFCPRMETDQPCSGCKYDLGFECNQDGKLADHLLSNGVIVPPCNVGDCIYLPWQYDGVSGIAGLYVTYMVIDQDEFRIMTDFSTDDEGFFDLYNGGKFNPSDFGKTVFLTREEAEKALAEREGKG